MSLGAVLDTAIGLVFTYFLLAIIASGVQEVVAGIFSWRGTYLSKGIDVILDNHPGATFRWAGVADFIRAHFTNRLPLTAADRLPVNPPPLPPDATDAQHAAHRQQQEQQETLHKVLSVQTHPLLRGTPSQLPSYVPARNFALALLEALRDGSQAPLFSQAERTISKLPDGDLKRTLSLFVQNAGGDLDTFRGSLETWFDDAMDRLSGIYTRMSQYVMLILGLFLALVLNVDSMRLARSLWLNNDLRAGIVADAVTSGKGSTPSLQQALSTLEARNLPIGWGISEQFHGWGAAFVVIGWLFTAGAVGLGAPFWFGLLQQLVNYRSSGPPPARAPPLL